jgi:hypothetical protein
MHPRRITRSAALGLTLAALAAPAASAQQDLRSPDARDAARAAESQPVQDLRSPDTRDLAAGRGTFSAPEVTVVKVSEPVPSSDGGLDWADAGIGAGGMLGLVLVGIGGAFMVARRMHARPGRGHTAITG